MISLRNEIDGLLPPDTFLRIDRTGSALYAAAIEAPAIALLRKHGWTCIPAGRICMISPGVSHLERLRQCAQPSPQWQKFSTLPPDETLLPLFTALLRASEMPPTPPAHRKLEKLLRQTAATALRCHTGGGLELCETIFNSIRPI